MKKSFILYMDYWDSIQYLSDEQLGMLTRMLFEYQLNGTLPEKSNPVFMAFSFIKTTMDRDMQKWENKAEKSRENGQKGGRPSKNQAGLQETQKTQQVISEPKKPVNVSVNGSVSDNDNESVSDNVSVTHIVPPQAVESPQKGKHLFKHSPYFEMNTFIEAFKKTKCFARHPNLDIELIHDMMVNSEAKGYKYTNWIMAAAQWVERKPEQFIFSIESKLKSDPAYALMNKGDKIAYEAKLKREMQRTLIHDPNDPYSY